MKEYLEYNGIQYYLSYGNWYTPLGMKVVNPTTIKKLDQHYLETYKSV